MKLTTATRSVGEETAEDLRRAGATVLPGNKDRLEAEAVRLEEAWAKHVAALEAASAYARSLQSVVDAAGEARQSVQNVTEAATRLANTVGLRIGSSVSIASDALAAAYTHIANARGRKTLIEAMDDLAPAIDQVASILEASLDDLRGIVEASSLLQLNSLRADHATELGYRNRLVNDRRLLYQKGWDSLSDAEKQQLQSIEQALATADAWHEPYLANYNAIATRRDQHRLAVTAVQRGVKEWAATHSQLRIALKEGERVDTTALIDTVTEIRDLVQRIRDR